MNCTNRSSGSNGSITKFRGTPCGGLSREPLSTLTRVTSAARRCSTHDLDARAHLAVLDHAEPPCRGSRQIDDRSLAPIPSIRSTVDNPNSDAAAILEAGDANDRSKWQRAVGGDQGIGIEARAACGLFPLERATAAAARSTLRRLRGL
jgi:hypothetical protein